MVAGLGERIHAARPRVVAALAAQFRDLDAAETGFDGAVEALLASGTTPDDVAAWLFVSGRRKVLDARRKAAREARAVEEAAMMQSDADVLRFPDAIPDERLGLLFICCHPAIALEARVMLTLRIVLGVEVEAIATGFAMKPDAVRQRITRAKAKIGAAGVPFELPHRRFWGERVEGIAMALEQAFVAAYREGARAALAAETERLALLLVELLPGEGEVVALAAMILLARSRETARAGGIALSEQDASLWDRQRIETARDLLDREVDGAPGRYRLLALVHLTHARRAYGAAIDWAAIRTLYDALVVIDPSPGVAIARAVAIGRSGDAEAGLAALPAEPGGDAAWHATRADLLERAGQEGAAAEWDRALELAKGEGPRALIAARRTRLSRASGS